MIRRFLTWAIYGSTLNKIRGRKRWHRKYKLPEPYLEELANPPEYSCSRCGAADCPGPASCLAIKS